MWIFAVTQDLARRVSPASASRAPMHQTRESLAVSALHAATHDKCKYRPLHAPDLNPRASAASNSPATLLGVAVVCIPHLVRADLMERTAPPKRSVLLRKRSSVQYCGQVVTRGRARKPGGTPQSGEKFAERDEPSIISKRRMGSIDQHDPLAPAASQPRVCSCESHLRPELFKRCGSIPVWFKVESLWNQCFAASANSLIEPPNRL